MRGIDLHSRLLSSEPLRSRPMESCRWDVAAPERDGVSGAASGGAAGRGRRWAIPTIAARLPVQTIRDPYAGFAAIRVDPVHNEVVMMDEFKFNIYVYDRLAVTPASAMQTTPKRFIGGGKTLSRYNSDGYVDTKTGDIYIVNNDSEPGLFVFPRTAEGNVEPGQRARDAVRRVRHDRRRGARRDVRHDPARRRDPGVQEDREGQRQRDSPDSGQPDAAWPIRTASPSIRRRGCSTSPTTAPSATKTFDSDQPMPHPLNTDHAARRDTETAELARRQRRYRGPPGSGVRHRQVRSAVDHGACRRRQRQRRAGPADRRAEGAVELADRHLGRFRARRDLRRRTPPATRSTSSAPPPAATSRRFARSRDRGRCCATRTACRSTP